ncbi:hypothetical protein [Shewanella benthica]|uniref:Uncharacterized protein n=1 Tax=Shewanella benthica KT99 TaxID=314608 RepID=A9CYB1_9GAMM|nr:hypothetical protein [Shewanella benthica]EDQ02444.1 hypothetical protein KT99_02987 [Shewanella benthica KT99]
MSVYLGGIQIIMPLHCHPNEIVTVMPLLAVAKQHLVGVNIDERDRVFLEAGGWHVSA